MKCLIVYFSQTYSTKEIAETIGNTIKEYDWEVDLKNIKYDKPDNILEYDLLGLGTPVYYYRLPFLFKDFLRSLPVLENKTVFSFISYGTYFFDVPTKLEKILKGKEADYKGLFAARGSDRYLGYLKFGAYFSEDHPNKTELTQAKYFTESIIDSFSNKSSSKDISNYQKSADKGFIYDFESVLTNRWLINNFYTRFFSSNEDCIGCGECVKKCPQNNVILDNKKKPQWGKNCELCFMCEMVCPVQAINSIVDMKIFLPILKYNINQGKKDDNIDYTEINYKNGKITK